MTVDIGIASLRIIAVFMQRVTESAHVVMSVITHLMTSVDNLLIEFRIFTHIVAHHKERGFHVELLECLENKRCSLGDRTIIEGQVNCLLMTVHSPKCFGIEPTQIDGWLFDNHGLVAEVSSLCLVDSCLLVELLGELVCQFAVDALCDISHLLHDVQMEHTFWL